MTPGRYLRLMYGGNKKIGGNGVCEAGSVPMHLSERGGDCV
jgi:hypothetical protein